jgi:uncharacterized membrane protein
MEATPYAQPARVQSLDILKGLVMVIMTLDHVRDYFHASAFYFDPTDATQTTLPIFFTRWITHYCAPIFSFLAGVSAYLVGRRKSVQGVSAFLLKRGLWLVFVEVVIVNFAWFFDPSFHLLILATIWALGVSMIALAGLVYLPQRILLGISILVIVGHNLLDGYQPDSVLWSILHDRAMFMLGTQKFFIGYALIPWIAIMSLGYAMGFFYDRTYNPAMRRRQFVQLGWAITLGFLVVTGINVYGDTDPWVQYPTVQQTLMSFLDRQKYPPSLQYLMMTLGPAFLFLGYAEAWKGKVADFFTMFGRVPFFFYILHLYVIHALAMVLAQATGFGWQAMVLTTWVGMADTLQGYGLSLWGVYGVWGLVIALCYPICRAFDAYKTSNKHKAWLSYL